MCKLLLSKYVRGVIIFVKFIDLIKVQGQEWRYLDDIEGS